MYSQINWLVFLSVTTSLVQLPPPFFWKKAAALCLVPLNLSALELVPYSGARTIFQNCQWFLSLPCRKPSSGCIALGITQSPRFHCHVCRAIPIPAPAFLIPTSSTCSLSPGLPGHLAYLQAFLEHFCLRFLLFLCLGYSSLIFFCDLLFPIIFRLILKRYFLKGSSSTFCQRWAAPSPIVLYHSKLFFRDPMV